MSDLFSSLNANLKAGVGAAIRLGCFLLVILASCSPPSVIKVWSDEKHVVNPKQPHKFIYFVQSNNQVNSRVAQDELVRLSSNPSIQGYLYTKGEPINSGNRETYRTRMQKEGYDYVVVLRLTDSTLTTSRVEGGSDPSGNRSFNSDYSFQIDPYAYNPGYERENKIFQIETNVYYVATGNLVWTCVSKIYNPETIEKAVKETSKEVIKKMKRQGFMK